jgi:hypothetical protein
MHAVVESAMKMRTTLQRTIRVLTACHNVGHVKLLARKFAPVQYPSDHDLTTTFTSC